jgi:hypothetical protein
VNRPSIEALIPDHGWGNSCQTQSCRKRKERKCGGKEEKNTCDGYHRRKTGGTMEIQGVLNRGEGE